MFAYRTDQLSLATRHESGPTPSGGTPSHNAPAAARHERRLWWVAAGLLAFLALGAVLFARQAIDHQRVEKDLDLAAAAFAAARGVDARQLAPEAWQLAATRIDEAMAELHRQDGRFALVRSYMLVHEMLTKAVDAAEIAKATADTARNTAEEQFKQTTGTAFPRAWGGTGLAEMKDEARAAIDAAKATFTRALDVFYSVEKCPRAHRAKEIRMVLEVTKGQLEGLKDQLSGLDARYAHEDFPGARAAADTLKGALEPIIKDLEGIRTKFKCR